MLAANTKESKEIHNNNNESCVDGNDIEKKYAEIMPNIDIEDNVEQERWAYTNKYNKWEGGDFSVDKEHDQNRMSAREACIDRIRKNEVANILLSFNRKSKLDDSFKDEEEKSSKGENKDDKDDQFEANVKKSGKEWRVDNVGVCVWKMPAATQHAKNVAQNNVV
jgi:hypothetical protein